MAQNHHIVTWRDMMENEAISWAAIADFLYPPEWMKSLGRAVITTCDMFGHGFILKMLATIAKVVMFFVCLFLMWIPFCVFFEGARFFVASWIRLINGLGQRESLFKNLWFCGGYTFALAFVYVPWLLPMFYRAVSWQEILQYIQII